MMGNSWKNRKIEIKNNRRYNIVVVIIFLLFLIGGVSTKADAAKIMNLKENRSYKVNLDLKGKKEILSYSMNKKGIIKIKVNGKRKTKIRLDEYYYSPQMQVLDIDKKDKTRNLWVYAYADSEDICYSALYEYRHGQIIRIWNLKNDVKCLGYRQRCGKLISTNGRGDFTVAMDRALEDVCILIGNHWDEVKFQLENGKVKQVSKRTFQFYETYVQNAAKKNGGLLTAGRTEFYFKPNQQAKTFTVKKGMKCYPKKAYVQSDSRLFVLFKLEDGRKGWLCTVDYSFERCPFSNIALFD